MSFSDIVSALAMGNGTWPPHVTVEEVTDESDTGQSTLETAAPSLPGQASPQSTSVRGDITKPTTNLLARNAEGRHLRREIPPRHKRHCATNGDECRGLRDEPPPHGSRPSTGIRDLIQSLTMAPIGMTPNGRGEDQWCRQIKDEDTESSRHTIAIGEVGVRPGEGRTIGVGEREAFWEKWHW